ncbi:Na+-driven multidrug efflux pump [Syntrophus gentianae]|uniref:Na+-driven multidrug efflux pump n=1 Tax=Syntrophus gentianae TaxID=43775 RepID=A0A1H7UNH9_9BACT|nr:oligosaccharide flippase family protein [Syntrophus gentianae]SEL98560.1 Na+-driven multidrug efflux pump [Syntrophus gentianae]
MGRKQLFINMAANIASFSINFGITFFLTPYLIRMVGREAYGFMPLAINFTSYFAILTTSLNSMAARFITIKIHQNDGDTANKYFSTIFFSNLFMGLILGLISTLIVVFLGSFLVIPDEVMPSVKLLFAFILLSSIISLIFSVFGVATFCTNRLDIRSGITIAQTIFRAVLLLLFFTIFKPDIAIVGFVTVVVVIIEASFNFHFTKKLLAQIKIKWKNFDIKVVKLLVGSGIWNSVNQLSTVLLNGLSLLIANVFLGPSETGYLAIVQTIPHFILSLIAMLVSVFVPQFTILYAKRDNSGLLNEILFSIKVLGVFVSIPIAGLIAFGDIFYSLWVPGQDANLLQLLSVITISVLFVSGSINSLYNIFTVTNKLKIPSVVLLLTGITNVLGVAVLLKITSLGIIIIPAVYAILSTVRSLVFTPVYAARCLGLRWNIFYNDIIKGILAITIITAMLYTIRLLVDIDCWTRLILFSLIGGILALLINSFVIMNAKDRLAFINIVRRALVSQR